MAQDIEKNKSKIPIEIRKEIFELANQGIKQRDIANIIKEKYNIKISQQTVSYILKTNKNTIITMKDEIVEIDNKVIEQKLYHILQELLEKLPYFLNHRNYPEILKTITDAYVRLKQLENEKIINNNLVGVKIEFVEKQQQEQENNEDSQDT